MSIQQKTLKKWKIVSLVCALTTLLSTAAFATVFFHAGYHVRVLEKFKLCPPVTYINTALKSWEYCLPKMNYQADAVFLGDSITEASDFGQRFSDLQIVNMGISGDTISGMTQRIPAVQLASPKKVFLLGGINSLDNDNVDQEVTKYEQMLTALKDALPDTQIYVQSVLPISAQQEATQNCSNTTISTFNSNLQALSEKFGFVYIDLYSLYAKDGYMNSALSEDGLHLTADAYSYWAEAIGEFLTK